MHVIELTDGEAQALVEALEWYVSELRMEIADTERLAMRGDMKERRVLLQQVIERLKR